jgi:hypothetical protein
MALNDILSGLLGAGAQTALANYGVRETRQAGVDVQQNLSNIANQYIQGTQFKPYTVTSGMGTSTSGPTGTTGSLSPEMQQAMQQLLQGGMGMFGQATQPIDQRATDLMGQLEAAAAPSRERERLALEQRLLGQGRLGVQTSMFGGTPEGLAMAKAIEEQRLNNAVLGRQQAMGEQAQAFNIGQGMFNSAFTPQQMQNQTMQVATPFAQLSDTSNRQAFTNATNLQMAGTESRIQSEQQANALRQIYLQQALQGLLAPRTNSSGQATGGLLSEIFGNIGGLFNGSSFDPTGGMTDAQYQAAIGQLGGN